MLVTDDKNADTLGRGTVDKRVREATHWMHAQRPVGGSAETWVADEQTGDAGELREECRSQGHARLPPVERGCCGKLDFSLGMK